MRVLLLVQSEEMLYWHQDIHELFLFQKQQEVLKLCLLIRLPSFDADSAVEQFHQTSDGLLVVLKILNNIEVTFSSSENAICPNLSLTLTQLFTSNS